MDSHSLLLAEQGLFPSLQIKFEGQPPSYQMSAGCYFPESKLVRAYVNNSPPSSVKFKNVWSYTLIRLHDMVLGETLNKHTMKLKQIKLLLLCGNPE